MTGIRYPNSADWLSYDYDKMGRLIAIPGFAGSKSNPGFIYDENSALQSVKTDNGVETSYQRDKNGRITNINATKSDAAILSLTYAYDAANNIIQRNDNTYVYDKLNRLQRATIYGAFEDKFTKADMLMGTADQDYHGDKEVEENITDQTQVKLDFAARSLILDLQTEADNISKVELIPEVTGHRVPVDQIEIYYRSSFMFVKLERDKWIGTKDDQGRVTIKFTPLLKTGELKIHCNYDDLDIWQAPLIDRSEFYNSPEKLVTVYQKFARRTESYEYDAMGNRTVERILLRKEYGYTYTYYPNSNRLQSKVKQDGTERIDYAYDENGNLISKVVTKGEKVNKWEYAYDLLNQLEQVKKNGEVVSSYVYDPNGFRVEKVGSKGKIHYVPLLNGEVGYRKEFSSNKEYSFIYVGIQHLARVNGVIGGSGKKFFYHNDHLGSALAVTDESGNKVVERDFTPFGERINTDVYDDEPRDIKEDESGFTGKDWDEDVGLYYYNARWYDLTVGRFISQDPVGDDPTLYVYGFNNPLSYIDPSGQVGINIVGGLMNLAAREIPGLGDILGVVNMFRLFVAGPPSTTTPESNLYQMSQGELNIDISEGISKMKEVYQEMQEVNNQRINIRDFGKTLHKNPVEESIATKFKEFYPFDPFDYLFGELQEMFNVLFPGGGEEAQSEKVDEIKQTQEDAYILPTEGTVTSVYGKRTPPEWYDENGNLQKGTDFHYGWDIGNAQGTRVVAIGDGEVVYAQKLNDKNGNVVIIKHKNGDYSYYFHVQNMQVKKGDFVTKGINIAEIGNVGTGPHLHFAMARGDTLWKGYYNPIFSLPGLADLPRKSGQVVENNGQFSNVIK
jgi:RHS repeat-associated protein